MQERDKIEDENFIMKYERTNAISRFLIERFFKSVKALIPDDVQQVLEVGCGAGYSTFYLSKFLGKVIFEGSELDPSLAQSARERNPGVPMTVESIYNLNRKNGSFDLVIALEVLEHLEDPDAALKELQRVSSSYVIVSVPREPIWRVLNMMRGKYLNEYGNTPGHIHHWSSYEFVKLLEKYFTVCAVKSPLPWTIVLCKK